MHTRRKHFKKREKTFKVQLNLIREALRGVFEEVKGLKSIRPARASEEHYEIGQEIVRRDLGTPELWNSA